MSTSTPASPPPGNDYWTAALPWGVLVYLALQIMRAILDALDAAHARSDAPPASERHVKLYHSLREARELLRDCDAP